MSKKLIAMCVFVFGMGLAASAAAITPEMAQCIAEKQAQGWSQTAAWNCCVRNICPIDLEG